MAEPVDLRDLRLDLMASGLDEREAPADPFELFDRWLEHSTSLGLHNANAMAIATADAQARPSVRNVLLRGRFDGGLAFYTNYESQKGRELSENPHAEALFSWLPLERQVRFTGSVERVSEARSDAYFATRARDSRISAIASAQSRTVESRARLEELHAEVDRSAGDEPARPDHWGGYLLVPHRVEFWQGREHRLHDRLLYTRRDNAWDRSRLAP